MLLDAGRVRERIRRHIQDDDQVGAARYVSKLSLRPGYRMTYIWGEIAILKVESVDRGVRVLGVMQRRRVRAVKFVCGAGKAWE